MRPAARRRRPAHGTLLVTHQLSLLTEQCQRWRRGRDSYRPAGEIFDPRHAAVCEATDEEARAFVVEHHYSRSFVASRFSAKLVEKRPFQPERMLGVAVFSVPQNQSVVPSRLGIPAEAGVELGRFVLLDEAAANAESWTLARAFRLLRTAKPNIRGIVSYCDPTPRFDEQGRCTKAGHTGTIYRAHNATYGGLTKRRQVWLSRNGQALSERALSKLKHDDRGSAYVYRLMRRLGAPERRPLEAAADYISRALTEGGFQKQACAGKHVFTWTLQ